MAVPNYLSSNFRYLQTAAVTDVATIITDLRSELVTNGNWSEPVANTFRSPLENGLSWDLVVSTVSTTRIRFKVYDMFGLLVNNQTSTTLDIAGGGSTVNYFTGDKHVCVDSSNGSGEAFYAASLDVYPDTYGTPRGWIVATAGPRSDAGSLTAQEWSRVGLLRVGGTSYTIATQGNGRGPLVAHDMLALDGAQMFFPVEIQYPNVLYGKVPQAVLVNSDEGTYGTEFTVPIDVAQTAVFRVTGHTATQECRIAFRKS